MENKILYAGPWIGEFGWELGWWNPLIRGMSKKYEEIIIACRKNSSYLYEYATEIVEISACPTTASSYLGRLLCNMPTGWGKNGKIISPESLYMKYKKCNHSILIPEAMCINLSSGIIAKNSIDIMCNFRVGKKHKEYPPKMCDTLVNLLLSAGYTMGCFGSLKDYYSEGALDLRNYNLKEQCAILGNAKCAIGHSSGAMHLASFCGCPHIIWHVKRPWLNVEMLTNRYKKYWNPFNTPMIYMPANIPKSEDIIKVTEELISREKVEK